MATRKIVGTSVAEDPHESRSVSELVRVEDSIEEFISVRLPSIGTAKLDVRSLWVSKDGRSRYYRCNCWQHLDDFVPTRRLVKSYFIRIDFMGKNKTLVDLTNQ